MRRRGVLASATAGVLGLAGCLSELGYSGGERRTETRTYNPAEGTALVVSNHNGDITVDGADTDSVEVDITREGPSNEALDAVSVTTSERDGELHLEIRHGEAEGADEVSVTLSIRCPPQIQVSHLSTTNGSVAATDVAGDLSLESTNGDVTAENVDGLVSLASTNGSLTARRIGGLAEATTQNGSIEVDVPAVESDVTIETGNGSIDAALASTLDITLLATAVNGSVEVRDVALAAIDQAETEVSGTIGEGRYDLSVTSANGSITLRSLSG